MKLIKNIVVFLIFSYVLFCLSVYFKPEKFFYYPYNYPSNVKKVQDDGFNAEEVTYHKYDNIDAKGWLYLNNLPLNNSKIVLFLHGNSYNVEKYYHKTIPFAKSGYSVFIPEYRGFGGQGNKIRQEYLTQDALNALYYLNSLGFKNKDIIVYGMSLGTYMALHTVVNGQENDIFNALILEVPFTSLFDVVKIHTTYKGINILPLDLLVKDKYNSTNLITKIKTRLLIMTTESDELIPYTQALNLYEQAPEPKQIKIYKGAAHDTLYNLANYEYIIQWLDK